MALTTPELVSGVALLLAILSAAWQRFGVMIDIQKQIAKVQSDFFQRIESYHITCPGPALTLRMTTQEMKMDLFWGAIQDSVKDMLKQPIHLRKDELLDKFPALSFQELQELKTVLMEEKTVILTNQLDPDKKVYLITLSLMIAGIDWKLIDSKKE
jgi:hypothetical protein